MRSKQQNIRIFWNLPLEILLSPTPKKLITRTVSNANQWLAQIFTYDSYGFTAHYTSDKERLVFFSVPYESGWTATVNGEPVDIENVNIGFMAVKVPAGTSEIQFHYQTPGLKLGAIVTGCAVPLLVAYVLIMKKSGQL